MIQTKYAEETSQRCSERSDQVKSTVKEEYDRFNEEAIEALQAKDEAIRQLEDHINGKTKENCKREEQITTLEHTVKRLKKKLGSLELQLDYLGMQSTMAATGFEDKSYEQKTEEDKEAEETANEKRINKKKKTEF